MRDAVKYNARNRELYASMSPEKKAARLAQCRAWNAANPEKRKNLKQYTPEERAAYMREWRKLNKDKLAKYRAKSADANAVYQARYYEERKEVLKPKRKEQGKAWRLANPHKVAALAAKRRAAKIRATPAWLTPDDHWIIGEVYELCDHRSRLTGVEHHVDHIVPLKGRNVCGLHVPLNLRVIPATDNMIKRNRFSDELLQLVA